jgi:hypothetical protein
VTLDGYTSSLCLSDVAGDSDLVDRLKWWDEQPHIAFVQPNGNLCERASQPFSMILSTDVLDNDCPEWYIWMN